MLPEALMLCRCINGHRRTRARSGKDAVGLLTRNCHEIYISSSQKTGTKAQSCEVEYNMTKLAGAKYRLVVFTLAPLAISSTVPASATSQATEFSWQKNFYAPDGL
jgi:hypothetical protein